MPSRNNHTFHREARIKRSSVPAITCVSLKHCVVIVNKTNALRRGLLIVQRDASRCAAILLHSLSSRLQFIVIAATRPCYVSSERQIADKATHKHVGLSATAIARIAISRPLARRKSTFARFQLLIADSSGRWKWLVRGGGEGGGAPPVVASDGAMRWRTNNYSKIISVIGLCPTPLGNDKL